MSSSDDDIKVRTKSKVVKADKHKREDKYDKNEEKLREKLKKKYKEHNNEKKLNREKELYEKMLERIQKEKHEECSDKNISQKYKESMNIKKRKSRHSSDSDEDCENEYSKRKTKKKKSKKDNENFSDLDDDEHRIHKSKYKDKNDQYENRNNKNKHENHLYHRHKKDNSSSNNENNSRSHHQENRNFKQKRQSGWDQETVENTDHRHDRHSRHDRHDRYDDNRENRSHTREWDRGKDNRHREYGRNFQQSSSSENKPKEKKEEPNFKLSGKLTEYTNTYNGVVIMYNEPTEARKPKTRWRLYPFKGDEALPMLQLHRQSAFLFGRDRKIADIPVDHPSCSKQHAVLQFRLVEYEREDASIGRRVKPYMIDLESTNGTFVNNKKIEPRRYVELLERDVVKFGFSSRDYVILHEKSKEEKVESEDGGENDDENDKNAFKMRKKK